MRIVAQEAIYLAHHLLDVLTREQRVGMHKLLEDIRSATLSGAYKCGQVQSVGIHGPCAGEDPEQTFQKKERLHSDFNEVLRREDIEETKDVIFEWRQKGELQQRT